MLSGQAQPDLDEPNKPEPDRYPDRIVTGRLLEVYDPSLVHRHISRSQCQSLGTSIEVLVNTFVSPF